MVSKLEVLEAQKILAQFNLENITAATEKERAKQATEPPAEPPQA
jgi:hypothetical protein